MTRLRLILNCANRRRLSVQPKSTLRAAFTLIEILVVIIIISILMGIVFAVYADSLEAARIEATRSTIRQLDSRLQDRLTAFERLNFRSQAQRFKLLYDNSNPPMPGQTPMPLAVAEAIIYKDRFRAAFPQRLEDLYGLDGLAATAGDNAPLLRVWAQTNNENTTGRPTTHTIETESIELFYLAITNGGSFGLPSLGIDGIDADHLQDTDGDGLIEIVDEWGNPLRFYNWPTRLVRPDGDVAVAQGGMGVADIDIPFYTVTAARFFTGVPDPAAPPSLPPNPMPFWYFNHPLNQDPQDPTGILSTARDGEDLNRNGSPDNAVPPPPYALNGEDINGNMMPDPSPLVAQIGDPAGFMVGPVLAKAIDEIHYHTLNTYHMPLIVSAGPDGDLGLHEPAIDDRIGDDPFDPALAPMRLAQPIATSTGDSALDDLYDNVSNRRR